MNRLRATTNTGLLSEKYNQRSIEQPTLYIRASGSWYSNRALLALLRVRTLQSRVALERSVQIARESVARHNERRLAIEEALHVAVNQLHGLF